MTALDLQTALAHWPALIDLPTTPVATGLIHQTWAVGQPPVAAVQRVAEMFADEVHDAIAAVTERLAERGVTTPTLIPTAAGERFVRLQESRYRALTWIDGHTVERVTSAEQAARAAALVARWHAALEDLPWPFVAWRPDPHDTSAHLRALEAAVTRGAEHRLYPLVAPVAQAILEHGALLCAALSTRRAASSAPRPLGHGDLKISNVRFDDRGQAVALVDLDTVGPIELDAELGDAWRSWTNRGGEDDPAGEVDWELWAAAAEAYLDARALDVQQRAALAGGTERIAIELAARFCRDALEERYFGWNERVAPSRGEHNLLRARGQLSVARSAAIWAPEMKRLLALP